MTLVVAIRPEPGCAATVTAARRLGLETVGFPLSSVEPVGWMVPEPETFDALLLGSANALRHGGAGLGQYFGKPAYAVGGATAQDATAAGLEVNVIGSGGLQSILDQLQPGHRHLLRLTGETRVPLNLPPGITMIERIVYTSRPLPMPDDLARLLKTRALSGAVVLLHSADAARHFADECARLVINRSRLQVAALGPRIADAAGRGWAAVASAENPDDTALLALARQMCQTLNVPKPEQ